MMAPPRDTKPTEPDEARILRYVIDCLETRGYPPSQKEIAAHCGWKAPSSANYLIRIMEARGLVRTTPGVARSISITESGMKALTEELT